MNEKKILLINDRNALDTEMLRQLAEYSNTAIITGQQDMAVGTSAVTSKQEDFTVEKLNEALDLMGQPPPSMAVVYSKHIADDDAYKCDNRKLGFNPFIGMPPVDIIYWVGKNVAKELDEQGVPVQNYVREDEDNEPEN
jgi:hypothetical protein